MERLNKITAWSMIIVCVVYYLVGGSKTLVAVVSAINFVVGGSKTLVAVVSAINFVVTIFNIRKELKNKEYGNDY